MGGVGGVFDGMCLTLATCSGVPFGFTSYCCTPCPRLRVNNTADGPYMAMPVTPSTVGIASQDTFFVRTSQARVSLHYIELVNSFLQKDE